MLELIVACKALQDFNMLQIVRLPMRPPPQRCDCNGPCVNFHPNYPVIEWERSMEKHVKGLGEWAVDCLKKQKKGRLKGKGRKRITLRTIEFGYDHPVKVKEYEV